MAIVGMRIKVVPSTMIQIRPFLRHLICEYFCLLSCWIWTQAEDHQTHWRLWNSNPNPTSTNTEEATYRVGRGYPIIRSIGDCRTSSGQWQCRQSRPMILSGIFFLIFKEASPEVQLLKPLRSLGANLTRQSWHGEHINWNLPLHAQNLRLNMGME